MQWRDAVVRSDERIAYRVAKKGMRLVLVNKAGVAFTVEDDKICCAVGQGQNKRYDDFEPFDIKGDFPGHTQSRLAFFQTFVNKAQYMRNGEAPKKATADDIAAAGEPNPKFFGKGLQQVVIGINKDLTQISEIIQEILGEERKPDLSSTSLRTKVAQIGVLANRVKELL